MHRSRGPVCIVVAATFLVAAVLPRHAAHAQEGTPAASPVAAEAVECPTAERLTVERLRELGAKPAPAGLELQMVYQRGGAAPAPFAGAPANEETVAAITATLRQYFACVDAGDWPAAYALNADDTIRYLVSDPARETFGVDPTTADYPFLDEDPTPSRRPNGEIEVSQATRLPDGRIGAVVSVEKPRKRDMNTEMLVTLVNEHDRWRIVTPLRRLPVAMRLTVPPETLRPVFVSYPGCPDDQRLTTDRLRALGASSATGEPDFGTTYFDIDELPRGDPADAATVSEVRKTIRQYFSCVGAWEWAAAYALYTDDTLRYLVTDPTREVFDVNPATAEYPFLDDLTFVASHDPGRISVSNVTVRPDGRVGAVIVVEDEPKRAKLGIRYIVLAWEHGRWRLVSPLGTLASAFGVAPTTFPAP